MYLVAWAYGPGDLQRGAAGVHDDNKQCTPKQGDGESHGTRPILEDWDQAGGWGGAFGHADS